ncbi:MAG TPA: alpha-(1-_3)-arabinofuranosyltransferase family protein [Gaiellaceae bacterium]|nr:alpha-(1->3)-arabinofuranosyltransferase family protein [Gaiellaceae bacterium]
MLAVDLNPVPHPHLPSLYFGIPEGTHAAPIDRLPIDLLFVGLGHIDAVAAGEKVLLLAIVFLAGWGMHRLVPSTSEVARFFGGILYAVNPFVYDRLDTGEWYLLLGYALLPWALAALLQLAQGRRSAVWRFAAVATAVGVASAHMFVLLAVLVLLVLLAVLVRGPDRMVRLAAIGAGSAVTCAASLYWLLPVPGLEALWRHVGPAQLRLYGTVPDHTWGLEGAVAGLYGYWNDPDPIKAHLAAWPLITAALIALALSGLAHRRRDPVAWAVAAAAAFGFLLALGGRGPVTGALYRAALDHVAVFRSFREPQKGVALLAFGYAYLAGAGVGELRSHVRVGRRRWRTAALAATVLLLPLIAGYREFGGLWGNLSMSTYPASWSRARALLGHEAADSRTLVLPWHAYFALNFAGHRVVANPAASYFDTPVLVSRSVGEGSAAEDSSDPLDRAVSGLLAGGARRRDLGSCLAALGVSHVLLPKQADWRRYSFLNTQRDLVLERAWGDLLVYRNTHPTALALQVDHRGTSPCDTRVTPLPTRVVDPGRIELTRPVPRDRLVALAVSPGPGWTMNGRRGRLLAGAIPTFRTSSTTATFVASTSRIVRRNELIGVIALVALGLLKSLLVAFERLRGGTRAASNPRAPSDAAGF